MVSVSSCFKKVCLANAVSEHEKQQFMRKCRLLNDIKPLLETLPRILSYYVLGQLPKPQVASIWWFSNLFC